MWITGASSGICRATAHACARRGDHLVLSSRAAGVLAEVQAECAALGAASVMLAPLDVTDSAAVDAAVAAAVGRHGRLDLVVSSAGVAAYSRVEESDDASFERVLETNVGGTFRVARAALRVLRTQEHGSLVVVGSVLGRVAVPLMGGLRRQQVGVARVRAGAARREQRPARGDDLAGGSRRGVDARVRPVGQRRRSPAQAAVPRGPAREGRRRRAEGAVLAAMGGRRGLGEPRDGGGLGAAAGRVGPDRPARDEPRRPEPHPVGNGEPAASGNLWAPRPELERLRRDPRARPDQPRVSPDEPRAGRRAAGQPDDGTLEP